MDAEFTESIKLIQSERGITEDLVYRTVEEFLLAAYKKTYGTSDNAVVRFSEGKGDVTIYAKKIIVEDDDLYDPVSEIELKKALELNEDCEIGDELLIEIDPKNFKRGAVQSAKQKARQNLREIQKDTLHSEFKDKIGEMIIGYYQREKNGTIFVDLGKTEGILPRRFQSPREEYHQGDRIKAMIADVKKTEMGLEIILTRSHGEFVQRIFELEVPEVYDGTVEVFKIVREPGYRTKVAVYSTRDDVDPVGACVGMKGVRIQAIVRELEGEKIDILKYDSDPLVFMRNALSPAEIQDIIVLDGSRRQALAIVSEQQLSLAIGKQGLNVRLANRLADWNIDVKTEAQFQEMDIAREYSQAASDLFKGIGNDTEEIVHIRELPDMPDRIVSLLQENGVELIENLIALSDEELENLSGLNPTDIEQIKKIIKDNVEIIESEENVSAAAEPEAEAEPEPEPESTGDSVWSEKEQGEEEKDEGTETYECPECGKEITLDMSECPNCKVGLSFEIEEVEEQEE